MILGAEEHAFPKNPINHKQLKFQTNENCCDDGTQFKWVSYS